MIPEDVKEKFELYRKWFRTLLRKEFINLPSEYQKRFLSLIDNFKDDCTKYFEEHKRINEKIIRLKILKIEKKEDLLVLYGKCDEFEEECVMIYPTTLKAPQVGEVRYFNLYSLDKKTWYASKEDLIKRGE